MTQEGKLPAAMPLRLTTDDPFGGCPERGRNDGYFNADSTRVFFCKAHRARWVAGSNLFQPGATKRRKQLRA